MHMLHLIDIYLQDDTSWQAPILLIALNVKTNFLKNTETRFLIFTKQMVGFGALKINSAQSKVVVYLDLITSPLLFLLLLYSFSLKKREERLHSCSFAFGDVSCL